MNKLKETVDNIRKIDDSTVAKTQKHLDSLTKPQGSLGRLEEIARKIVEITQKDSPILSNKVIFTMAADHGVVAEGISAFPQEVTPQMVYNFLGAGAGINVLAKQAGARVVIVDMGVKHDFKPHKDLRIKKIALGTKNIAKGPAMSKEEALKAVEAGIEVFEDEFEQGIDIVGLGDMGIGNTTASSAIVSVVTAAIADEVTGRGTGIDDKVYQHKIEVIKAAIECNKPDPQDGIDILSKIGGFEVGGLAGVILAACAHKVPVVIDGFISTAAALIAYKLEPKVKEYMIAAHSSVEKGHKIALDYLGLKPLLNLDLRLGEGTGAALAIPIIESSLKILTDMATFGDASVSEKL